MSMILRWLLLLSTITLCFIIGIRAQCPRISIRKEIRDLSGDELFRLHRAILSLNRRASPSSLSIWDRFARLHLTSAIPAHGRPEFLPWHRHFILLLEQQLQRIDPSVSLPYWDWSLDSQKPEESIVFTRNYFGGNGQGPSNCIQTGPYANFPLTVPDRHCLQRKFNGNSTLGVFSAPEVLSLLVSRTPDFFTFAKTFEATPHAAPHVNIGGDMSTMRSPNDPLFYLHHSFCDKLWLSFQQKGPNFKMQFNSPTNSSVNLDTPLLPFGIPVRSVMDTDALCYRYQEPSFRRRSTVNRPVPRDLTCHLVKAQESPKSFDYFQISPVISNSPIIEKIDCFLSALPSLPHTELNTTRLNAVLQQNPGPFDRTVENVAKLHLPNFIDTHWLHHMRLQECDIRKVEAFLMEITGDLNDLSGFTSIANME